MINDHERIALQFSGGKDSIACLYLLRPYWDRLSVLWVNTGAAFPETIEYMSWVRAMVPNFIEVKSDQPSQVERDGYPSDIVTWWDTPLGRALDSARTGRVQTPTNCCRENIWVPMQEATMKLAPTLVIRGQRNDEQRKGMIRSGDVVDGVTYWFPLEDWSEADVFAYLKEVGAEIPVHYAYTKTSLDCWSCTAYLDENVGKRRYMKRIHPELYAAVTERLSTIARETEREMRVLHQALEA